MIGRRFFLRNPIKRADECYKNNLLRTKKRARLKNKPPVTPIQAAVHLINCIHALTLFCGVVRTARNVRHFFSHTPGVPGDAGRRGWRKDEKETQEKWQVQAGQGPGGEGGQGLETGSTTVTTRDSGSRDGRARHPTRRLKIEHGIGRGRNTKGTGRGEAKHSCNMMSVYLAV